MATPEKAAAAPARSGTNVFAIVSLITSFFIAILGVIFGFIALNQIKKTGEQGRGLAIAGVIIGFIGIAGWIIFVIVWIMIFVVAAASGGGMVYNQ